MNNTQIEFVVDDGGFWTYQPIKYESIKAFSPQFWTLQDAINDALDFGYNPDVLSIIDKY